MRSWAAQAADVLDTGEPRLVERELTLSSTFDGVTIVNGVMDRGIREGLLGSW